MWSAFKSVFLLALCLNAASVVEASTNKVGNGGNSVVCKSTIAEAASARLLDFYEVDLARTFDKSLDEYAVAKKVFEALQVRAPELGAQYLKRLSILKNELEFKTGVILTDTKDSNHLFKPAGDHCEVIQTAIRRKGETMNEKRFLIRKDVWDQLPTLDRAGLLAHEIIYEHFDRLGDQTSVNARKVNAYIFKNEAYSAAEFWSLLRNLEVPIYP